MKLSTHQKVERRKLLTKAFKLIDDIIEVCDTEEEFNNMTLDIPMMYKGLEHMTIEEIKLVIELLTSSFTSMKKQLNKV